ncbi:MAG TPA: DUF4342 domain-containing protein [Anaerovoracaceae bacterium]|nr:DUF4342 domain-containing protein [Anaerovoracaceae bacterium]
MITLEQIEKLREKANVSYDDARNILEKTNGDILEALIELEKQGKVTPPEGGGYYSSNKGGADSDSNAKSTSDDYNSNRESLGYLIRKFVRFFGKVIHKGNINSIEVLKDGEIKTTFSITVLVLLAISFFWITIPLAVIGLFLGYRYKFKGPDLGKDNVNNAMNYAADAAENLKKSFSETGDQK